MAEAKIIKVLNVLSFYRTTRSDYATVEGLSNPTLVTPTLQTDLDIGAENSVTTTVSVFFLPFFKAEFKRYPPPNSAFGEDLN